MKTKRNFLSRRSDLIMIFHKCALNTSITNKLCFIENTYNIFINTSSIISNTTMRHQCVSFNVCYSINLSNAHARLQITANCVALVVVCRSECERYKIGNMFVEYKNMQMNRAQRTVVQTSRLREHCIFAFFVANYLIFASSEKRLVARAYLTLFTLVYISFVNNLCLRLNKVI